MANNRNPREIETRTQDERPKSWMPPEALPEPDKQPGFDYRWVRVSLNGNADPRNISSKLREGWEAVKIEEQPKYSLLTDPNGRFSENVEIGGLLLMKIPAEFLSQRKSYYDNLTRSQAEAVDNNLMRQSDSRMPLFKEGRTEVSVGKK